MKLIVESSFLIMSFILPCLVIVIATELVSQISDLSERIWLSLAISIVSAIIGGLYWDNRGQLKDDWSDFLELVIAPYFFGSALLLVTSLIYSDYAFNLVDIGIVVIVAVVSTIVSACIFAYFKMDKKKT